MSKQNKSSHTKLFICAGTIVILSMAAALLFLRWALNAAPAPDPIVTVVVMVLPVIILFILFVVLMKRLWPAKPAEKKAAERIGEA